MKIKETIMKITLIVLTIIVFAISCEKEKQDSIEINCISFQEGILNSEYSIVKSEMSLLTKDLKPQPTNIDTYGHLNNFTILLDRLNKCEGTKALLRCYACIKTYPPQSEILITINSNGNEIRKVLDFTTSKDTILTFSGMHD